jgi:hypothetical protein
MPRSTHRPRTAMVEAVHAYEEFGPEAALALAILCQLVIDASHPSPWAPRIVARSSYLPGTRQLVSIHPAMAYGGSRKCVAVPVSGRGFFVPARTRTRDPATIRTRGLSVMARMA